MSLASSYTGKFPIITVTTSSSNEDTWAGIITRRIPSSIYYEHIRKTLDAPLTGRDYNLVVDLDPSSTKHAFADGLDQILDIIIYDISNASSLTFSGFSHITNTGINAIELYMFHLTLLANTWQTNVVISLVVPASANLEFLALSGKNPNPICS